jgi:hypothetical protein
MKGYGVNVHETKSQFKKSNATTQKIKIAFC